MQSRNYQRRQGNAQIVDSVASSLLARLSFAYSNQPLRYATHQEAIAIGIVASNAHHIGRK
jgi:hypothetical protein